MARKKEGRKKFNQGVILFLKTIFFVCIGFLPSFLFIALFIQYGSPISNYVNFLSDFNKSWVAWIAAIIIILLFFSIGKILKSPKEIKHALKNKKRLTILIVSLVLVIGLIVWQLYLYINFLLGNDILVSVSVDKDNFFFTNSSSQQVNFKMSVTMNPFCVAECNYELFDLSNDRLIESGAFNIASIFSKTKTYSLSKNDVPFGSQVLETFSVTCKSKKTIMCYTSGEESKRNVLITLNNQLSEEETVLLNSYKEEIISLEQVFYLSNSNLQESENNLINIDGYFSTSEYAFENLSSQISELNDSLKYLEELWTNQNLNYLSLNLPITENVTFKIYNAVTELKQEIYSDIAFYNNLTKKLKDTRELLIEMKNGNLTESSCGNLNENIIDFNDACANFEIEPYLSAKDFVVNETYLKVLSLYNSAISNSGNFSCSTIGINNNTFVTINYDSVNQSIPEISLDAPAFYCCYLGDCEKCCDDSCSNENYPVIFLHGHSINGALPADYSFNTFMEIKNNLTMEGYVDAGTFAISDYEEIGIWGKINVPIIVTASYFFDSYKTAEGESTTIASKTEGVDTYAIRLRNIVNIIKERTNKDKVIIIAHSMGGVVTRRYIQIFGGDDIDKIILVSVPNHGITDKVKDYCAVFGSQTACNDMREDSLLMNQLNNGKTDFVNTYNIIGVGCDMGDDTGDGIVKNSSQYLYYANNFYVNGTCNEISFDFLHGNIISPKMYPETYEIIKEILLKSD